MWITNSFLISENLYFTPFFNTWFHLYRILAFLGNIGVFSQCFEVIIHSVLVSIILLKRPHQSNCFSFVGNMSFLSYSLTNLLFVYDIQQAHSDVSTFECPCMYLVWNFLDCLHLIESSFSSDIFWAIISLDIIFFYICFFWNWDEIIIKMFHSIINLI